jgi:hypothetical protein
MIRNDPPNRRDDRAVSVAVTHVLAIGITTILIVGLLTAAGGLAQDEQERSAREQLRMIGASMANQIEQADDLGRRGANVSVREDFQGTISGKSYTVSLENGSECDAATIDTDTCLILDLSTSDVSTTVGVSNRSPVTFEHLGSGTVRIVSEPGGAAGEAPYDPNIIEQIGVGGEVYDLPPGTGSMAELNKPPIARFTVDPSNPQYWDIIILNASGSTDPEANISKYIWNFTEEGDPDPGRFNTTTEEPTLAIPTGEYDKLDVNPLDAGRYKVELTVVDPVGNKGRTSEFVKVAGLVYGGDARAKDYDSDSDPAGVYFHLINKHSNDATVTEIFINPEDDDIDSIEESESDPYHDVVVYTETDLGTGSGSTVGYIEDDNSPGHIDIFDGGRILNINETGAHVDYDWDMTPVIDPGDEDAVHFIEFQDVSTMSGKSGEAAFRYYTENSSGKNVYYSTQFDFTVDSPYLKNLNPSTYAQSWQAGSSGKQAKPRFKRINSSSHVSVRVLDTSDGLKGYDWNDTNNPPYAEFFKISGDMVKVNVNLQNISISEKQYIVVEVTVKNAYGSKTKRLFIEVKPNT